MLLSLRCLEKYKTKVNDPEISSIIRDERKWQKKGQ